MRRYAEDTKVPVERTRVMLPNGTTVGETLTPQLAGAYKDGRMPPLLGSAS